MNSRLAIGLICLLSGILIDQAWQREFVHSSRVDQGLMAPLSSFHPRTSAQILKRPQELKPRGDVSKGKATVTATEESAPSKLDTATELREVSALESRMEELAFAQIPELSRIEKTKLGDGSSQIFGVTQDGREVMQHFNSRGQLMKESWKRANGENFFRQYYENGRVRNIFWSDDKENFSASYRESGVVDSRQFKNSDGKYKFFDHDENGGVLSVHDLESEGVSEGIQDPEKDVPADENS